MADDFPFPGPIWFVAPKPPYRDIDEFRRVVLHGLFEDGDTGRMVPVVYAFSDEYRAEAWLKKWGDAAAPYSPRTAAGDDKLVELLLELQSDGFRFLGTDSEQGSTLLVPIDRAVNEIRRRQRDSED